MNPRPGTSTPPPYAREEDLPTRTYLGLDTIDAVVNETRTRRCEALILVATAID